MLGRGQVRVCRKLFDCYICNELSIGLRIVFPFFTFSEYEKEMYKFIAIIHYKRNQYFMREIKRVRIRRDGDRRFPI
jgi:hypothetical protein